MKRLLLIFLIPLVLLISVFIVGAVSSEKTLTNETYYLDTFHYASCANTPFDEQLDYEGEIVKCVSSNLYTYLKLATAIFFLICCYIFSLFSAITIYKKYISKKTAILRIIYDCLVIILLPILIILFLALLIITKTFFIFGLGFIVGK